MSLEIYRDTILEHYNNPISKGRMENADVVAKDYNPSCGDEIEIQIKFNGDKIEEIKFDGQGCAISQSSTDILLNLVKGKESSIVNELTPEEFLNHLELELSPARLKCALLGLKVLKTAVYMYLGNEK